MSDIHVWRCDLDAGAVAESILDPSELERAAAFRFPHLRRRYLAAHGFLRSVLAAYLHREPSTLNFAIQHGGKPLLCDGSLQFNLSHSDGVAYLAVTAADEIGVDVELSRSVSDAIEVGTTVFSASETDSLREQAGTNRDRAFLRAWTRKEAFVKLLGLGIGSVDLRRIHVGTAPDPVAVMPIPGISSTVVHVCSLDAGPHEQVAVAATRFPVKIERYEFPASLGHQAGSMSVTSP